MPPEMKETEEVEFDDGLGDLIDLPTPEPGEQKPEKEPTPTPEATDQTEKPEEPETAEPTDDAGDQDQIGDAPETTSDDEDETYSVKGKKYSRAEIMADPELFKKIMTGFSQQGHYQELHGENKKVIDALQERVGQLSSIEEQRQQALQQAAAAEPQRPGIKPEQLEMAYRDERKGLIEAGFVEEDMAELYPVGISNILALRDTLNHRIGQIEQQLGGVMNYTAGTQTERAASTIQAQFDGIFNQIASEGGIFEPLSTREARDEFLNEIEQKFNPSVTHLLSDPGILRELWVGKHQETLMQAFAATKKAEAARLAESKRLAAGEGGGIAPSTGAEPKPQPGELEGWADII